MLAAGVIEMEIRTESLLGPPLVVGGVRVLVERRLPLGLASSAFRPDIWAAALAPSFGLRRWYAERRGEFEEFARRYDRELDEPVCAAELWRLREIAARQPLILQVATRVGERGHAAVLVRRLRAMPVGEVPERGGEVPEQGGDAACWLDRVCPACGRIPDGRTPPSCPLCGAPMAS